MTEENKVTEVNEVKKKKSKLTGILLGIIVVAIAGYGIYEIASNLIPRSNDIEDVIARVDDSKSGRKIDYYDLEWIESRSNRDGYPAELEREPYKNNSLLGGQMVITNNGENDDVLKYVSNLYDKKGNLWYSNGAASLRHPEDELVDPNQTEAFNEFVNNTTALDEAGQSKLNDEQIESYATLAETIALEKQSPAYYYVGELIRNLKGKNPTLSSVYYLMVANRISTNTLVSNEDVEWFDVDYSNQLDTSYKGESQEKSLVENVTHNIEIINKKTGLVHYRVDGSLTQFAIEDTSKAKGQVFLGNNNKSKGDDMISVVMHYKDISNYMIAEYVIHSGNQDIEANDIMPGDYSYYKPAFTWCISPKIEKIASVYYDVIEPQVYKGTFTTREKAYEQVKKQMKDKYSIEEIQSAVRTYEYWALIE